MKLIKIDTNNYTIDEKFCVPSNYNLKCKLALKAKPEVFDVDQSFFTDTIKEAEYEIEGDLVRIAFPVHDVITEIFIDTCTGDVKVQFEYTPTELVKTEVEKFLFGILKPSQDEYCDSILCRYKHQFKIIGECNKYFWD
jgi:hypothetical protein